MLGNYHTVNRAIRVARHSQDDGGCRYDPADALDQENVNDPAVIYGVDADFIYTISDSIVATYGPGSWQLIFCEFTLCGFTDAANSAREGNYTEAGIGIVFAIVKPAKVLDKLHDAARGVASSVDDVVRAAQRQFPGLAGKVQQHHVVPRYLGGAANGRTVPLDAAYHQQITNEFRRLWPYGQGTPTAQQLERIMQQVYEKYPLPPGL